MASYVLEQFPENDEGISLLSKALMNSMKPEEYFYIFQKSYQSLLGGIYDRYVSQLIYYFSSVGTLPKNYEAYSYYENSIKPEKKSVNKEISVQVNDFSTLLNNGVSSICFQESKEELLRQNMYYPLGEESYLKLSITQRVDPQQLRQASA